MDNTEIIDVGDAVIFNHHEQLHNQLIDLRDKSDSISSEICLCFSKTLISDVTSEDIKISSKKQLGKKQLGEHLLSLISLCNIVCHNTNIDHISNSDKDICKISETQLSEVSACVEKSLSGFLLAQNKKFDEIDRQVEQLQYISNALSSKLPNVGDDQHQYEKRYNDCEISRTVNTINNPTKCMDNYVSDFISSDRSNKIVEFLDNCNQFSEKNENGHSVALFGYPYHYTGSSHSDKPVDIPEPILQVIEDINANELYSQANINSCLVNKYSGPGSHLPRHADNEHTIEPGSVIFTVSLGKEVKVKFTEIHSKVPTVIEQTVHPNSLYVMSHASQSYWEHEIDKCKDFSDTDVRYSLTFRHVSTKFLRSAVIIGDSNTQSLHFGEGEGTFGHNIPGRRVKAIHIEDIDPVDCCGYKNIFLHSGVNNIKHHSVCSPENVVVCFELLKNKMDIIRTLCPKSKLVVSPILPTKDREWNTRALYFNKLLFDYENKSNGKVKTHDFNGFCDFTGKLSESMGRYKKPSDPLHLGSSGIRLFVKLIRDCVYKSDHVTSDRLFNDVVRGKNSGVSRVRNSHRGVAEQSQSSFAPT